MSYDNAKSKLEKLFKSWKKEICNFYVFPISHRLQYYDELYIISINIVRIGMKGLLPVQCTVAHFLFTCSKAFATNLSSKTDSFCFI
jgi:hypothetical protein